MKQPTFKQWGHLEPADKARRIEIAAEKLKAGNMFAKSIFSVAARLDGDLELAQELLTEATPYSWANTRYSTWVKFHRLNKPFDAILALAHKPNLVDDTKQLLANDLNLPEELQLLLTQETNPELVGNLGANPGTTPRVMEVVSEFKNVIARARLAENAGLSLALMEKLLADKRQAQVGLAKNWMITEEIRQKLFETLDPEVVLNLAKRDDSDPEVSLKFAQASIAKHQSSKVFEILRQVDQLALWLIEQPQTPMDTWLPYLESTDTHVFSAAISRLPIDHPGLEGILEKNLDRYSASEAVLKHPGFTDRLVDKFLIERDSRYKLQPLFNPHLSERSVTKLVEHAEMLVENDLKTSLERVQQGWLSDDAEYAIYAMYLYLYAGGKYQLERIQKNIEKMEAESKKDLNPDRRYDYSQNQADETEEANDVKPHKYLGYQDPDISPEWLLKNVKNRSDEVKKDVLLNPSLPVEAMRIFALDKKPEIRKALGLLPNCPDDIKALVALQ